MEQLGEESKDNDKMEVLVVYRLMKEQFGDVTLQNGHCIDITSPNGMTAQVNVTKGSVECTDESLSRHIKDTLSRIKAALTPLQV
mgnify:CR=1 FL=1